jgi:hypothetical protein
MPIIHPIEHLFYLCYLNPNPRAGGASVAKKSDYIGLKSAQSTLMNLMQRGSWSLQFYVNPLIYWVKTFLYR